MAAALLEVKVHIVTGSVTSAQNIVKCCNQAGLEVEDIVLEPLASSQAVLSPDEQEVGVVLVDIGGVQLISQSTRKAALCIQPYWL